MQPLDCNVFAPLKSHWSCVCHDFLQKNPGKVATKFNFNSLFSKAWLSAVVPCNIIAGFKACGVHPYDRSAVNASPPLHKDATISHTSLENESPATEDDAHLSQEKEELYRKRFEEGYDIYTDKM